MHIRFRVSAAGMNIACRRLGARLRNALAISRLFIVFNIGPTNLEITSDNVSEGVPAEAEHDGMAFIPCAVFQGLVGTLPFFQRRKIEVGFSKGKMCIDGIVFHNRLTTLRDFCGSTCYGFVGDRSFQPMRSPRRL